MITADTITDEQIRELRAQYGALPIPRQGDWTWPPRANNGATIDNLCASALGETSPRHSVGEHGDCPHWCNACRLERDARARCADILNARAKEPAR